MRKQRSARRHRVGTAFSNLQAAVLTTLAFAIVAAIVMAPLLRPARSDRERDDWTKSVPWDPSWPVLPVVSVAVGMRTEVVRALYAFAGRNPDVMRYIPCYCGCQSQGHRSNDDCYVKQRSADDRVIQWDGHGLACPVGPDITGDVSLWREQGRPLTTIRRDIEREYGSRGPATPTPPVPDH